MESNPVPVAILAQDFRLNGRNLVQNWQTGWSWHFCVNNFDGPRLQAELFRPLS